MTDKISSLSCSKAGSVFFIPMQFVLREEQGKIAQREHVASLVSDFKPQLALLKSAPALLCANGPLVVSNDVL